MKLKFRIYELSDGRFEIQAKKTGFFGIFDTWTFWGNEPTLKNAITYCEETLAHMKIKYGLKKIIKVIKP